jgi:crotonobetainyl-CoA:carnitine CoA-transferase CaiB-like acyl-CoA transferase
MGQHMAQAAVTGAPPAPMPVRLSAWAIYDVFQTADDQQVFLGVVSDSQWVAFCAAFELADLGADPSLAANNDRVLARDRIMPRVREAVRTFTKAALLEKLERLGLPFAPIARPEDLFEDPHLLANGGLADITLASGARASLPALPLEMQDHRFGVRVDVPGAGEQSDDVLASLGFLPEEISAIRKAGVVA